MRNIFMSFLGTSSYKEVYYEFEGTKSNYTPFVQEAILEILKERYSFERIIFFLTDDARKKNWEDTDKKGLKSRLIDLGFGDKIKEVSIPVGSSEDEIMKIFLSIVDNIDKDDRIFFDITHSFRSLPMLSIVALIYARALKNSNIGKIFYGALEKLGPQNEINKLPKEKRVAPIFDLTSYSYLIEWCFAVEEFTKYGIASRLRDLSLKKLLPILRRTKGQDKEVTSLKEFIEQLNNLTKAIYTSRCLEIIRENVINSSLVKDVQILPEFSKLIDMVKQKVKEFETEDKFKKGISAVKWCLEHNLIQQGYTILEEMVITELMDIIPLEETELKKTREKREFVSSFLSAGYSKSPDVWKGSLKENKDFVIKLKQKGNDALKELSKVYDALSKSRNDINHCGFTDHIKTSEKLKDDLKRLVMEVDRCISNLRKIKF